MERFRINKVTIDHFRGYREKREFILENNPDIVIISGSNGFGKTSFFDAIEWGFTGNLTRYSEGNEEKSYSRFINYQPEESAAKVEIEFSSNTNKYVLIRESLGQDGRNTDYGVDKTQLRIVKENGETLRGSVANSFLNNIMIPPNWRGKINFTEVFSQYHLLTQDKLKNFVQGLKATKRYEQISALFGTERFFNYSKEFKQISDREEIQINTLSLELNGIETKIKVIEEYILNMNFPKLGADMNPQDYVNKLIIDYNEQMRNLRLNFYVKNSSHDIDELIKSFLSTLIDQKDVIKRKIYEQEQHQDKLKEIQLKKDEYVKNLKCSQDLAQAIQYLEDLKELNYLYDNFEDYTQYLKVKKDINTKISELKNQNKNISKQRSDLVELYRYFENLYNKLNNIFDEQGVNIISYTNNIKGVLDGCIMSFNYNNLDIEVKYCDGKFFILLNDIKVDLDKKNEYTGKLSEMFLNSTKELMNALSSVQELMISLETQKKDEEAFKNSIDKKINLDSTLDNELKMILNDSLEYIKKQNSDNEGSTLCPVCDSKFESFVLMQKISTKLSENNKTIEHNLEITKKCSKEIDNINKGIREQQEGIKKLIKDYLQKIGRYKDYITALGLHIKGTIQDQELNMSNLSNSLKELEEKFNNITCKLKAKELLGDYEYIKDNIIKMKNICASNLSKIGFNSKILDVNEMKNNLSNIKLSIQMFLAKINELNIDVNEIENEVFKRLDNIKSINSLYIQSSIQIKLLEDKLMEFSSFQVYLKKSKQLEILKKRQEELKGGLIKSQVLINRIAMLDKSVKLAVENINERIIDQCEEFINALFKRIYAHPNFRDLKLKVDINNHKNHILYIICANKNQDKINPAFTFSSAQMNAIAISIFLSLAIEQKCTNLDDIFFDDPIQNMDDINVLAFIDIIRSIVWNNKFSKQLFISTHDEQFFRILTKKFRFINTKIFRFSEYSLRGPKFKQYDTLNKNNEIILTENEFEEMIKNYNMDKQGDCS